jgi:uncharacterized ion transporter superfamily protein YfcC
MIHNNQPRGADVPAGAAASPPPAAPPPPAAIPPPLATPPAPVGAVAPPVAAPDQAEPPREPEQRRFTFPSAYTILFILLIVMAVLTWVIPAGEYDRNPAGEPIPNTYHTVPQNPQKLISGTLLAPITGTYGIQARDGSVSAYNSGTLYGAINVALFVLVIGGFLGLTMKTGAIDAGIGALVRGLGTRGKLLIPILMGVFMLGGTTYGMAEESLAFYALIIAAMIALRYDALTGVAVILLGCGIGTLASTINPFATGIASQFAGVSLADGLVGRLVMLVLGGGIGIWYVMRYAARVQADPSKSLVFHLKDDNEKHFLKHQGAEEVPRMTGQRKVVLSLFGLSFLIMIVSVIPWVDLGITWIPTLGWWFPELTALFLFFAIVIGMVGRMGEQELTSGFIDGARDLLGVALVVGLARGVSVVMNNGLIIDTVLHWAEQLVSSMGGVAFINTVAALYLPLSFLIPSSSGLATVSMPIMAPLADFAGVPKALVVTAYQSANGLINLVTPTFAVVAGGLALGRVPLNTWWRFAMPLVLLLAGLIVVVLSAGVLIRT